MLRALVCSVIVAVALPAFAHAEQAPSTALTVSPAITEWLVERGATAHKTVLVANTTKDPLPVSSLVRPFRLQETDYSDLAGSLRYDASSWLKVDEGDFILKPGKTRKVTLALKVPENASPGGHYATVFFRQFRPVGSAGAQAQVGALTFITVKGKIEKRLQGERLAASWSGGMVTVTAALRNTGNVHVMPEGKFVISDWRGKEVGSVRLPQGMVLPQTVRSYQAALKNLGYGVYTVKPVLSYGGAQRLDLAGVTVWAVPWKMVLFGACVLIVGWFGVYRLRGRWKRAFSVLTHRSD